MTWHFIFPSCDAAWRMLYSGLLNYCWPSALLFLHIRDRERQLTYTNCFLQTKIRLNISNFKVLLGSLAFLIHKVPAAFLMVTPINNRSRLMRNSYFLKQSPFKENAKMTFLTCLSLYHWQCPTKNSTLSLASSLRNMDVVCHICAINFNLYAFPCLKMVFDPSIC